MKRFHRLRTRLPSPSNAWASALAILLLASLAGCQSTTAVHDNPLPIDRAEYDRVFDAAVETLRDNGFAVDRQDYRFGRISTRPLGSPTAGEVWHKTNTTGSQIAESTVNQQRRVVNVFLESTDGLGAESERYQVRVEVVLHRRQMPARQVTHSVAPGRMFNEYDDVPHELKQRGIAKRYWQPVGRDPQLEQRLLAEIMSRSIAGAATSVHDQAVAGDATSDSTEPDSTP